MSGLRYARKWALFATLIVAGAVRAADLAPPWRGQPGTTYQAWTFEDADDPAAPEAKTNPYGSPTADITVGTFGTGWHAFMVGLGGRTGFWDIGASGTTGPVNGSIGLEIPNCPAPATYKEIWVQVTYFDDLTTAPVVSVPGAIFLGGQTVLVEHVSTGGDWLLHQSMWRMEPNPSREEILLTAVPTAGAVVDAIVVDTICVPEPAILFLVTLGSAVLRRRHG